ncbi:MAG: hypothetical protein KGJ78_02630 [Alphaproteobacteria bacterium]|nr:hypothetical protein [Alphaproteobacteria bacterium]
MKHLQILALVCLAGSPAFAITDLPMDTPTTVGGVELVCTGIGDKADDPRWKSYPLKLILAGKAGQYVSDADVTVTSGGKTVSEIHCGGPWILFKLSPGRYHFAGTMEGTTAATDAVVSASKKSLAVLRFPVTE